MNNNLILRIIESPFVSPYGDITRGSVLSQSDVDNNFLYLKGQAIYSAVSSNGNVTLKQLNGNDLTFAVGSSGSGCTSDAFWVSGSSAIFSIKANNNSGLLAGGEYSVAQGYGTNASASYSHAEGVLTIASGASAHAEGNTTIAGGASSHSEGQLTKAYALRSHAEGYQSITYGTASHAEGITTMANAQASHSEGYTSKAGLWVFNCDSGFSVVNGLVTLDSIYGNINSAFTVNNFAFVSDFDFSDNLTTKISKITAISFSSGTNTQIQLLNTGLNTTGGCYIIDLTNTNNSLADNITGDYTHAEGEGSIAIGLGSHAEGANTYAGGNYSHTEGVLTIAGGDTSHDEGYSTEARGVFSHSEGIYTLASGAQSHAEGYLTIASGNYSHAENSNTIASGTSAHAEGTSTIAGGAASHAEGESTTASGEASHAEGSLTIASGAHGHAQGQLTLASGISSHAGGYNSIASGNTSFVHGSGSTAGGTNTIVLGANITGITDNYVYVSSLNINTVGSSAFANDIRIDANGNLTTNTSDIRFKENINNITGGLDKIKKLQGVTYQWKDRSAGGEEFKLGFIAQQVKEVEPLLVFTNKNDGYFGVHIDGVIPLLVEGVKELSIKNDELVKDFVKLLTIVSATTNNLTIETQTILAEDNNIELNYSGSQETAIGGGIRVLHGMGKDLSSELITDENGNWVTNNDFKSKALTIPYFTPTTSADINGNEGNITRDNNFLYVKTSEGWKRSNLESF